VRGLALLGREDAPLVALCGMGSRAVAGRIPVDILPSAAKNSAGATLLTPNYR